LSRDTHSILLASESALHRATLHSDSAIRFIDDISLFVAMSFSWGRVECMKVGFGGRDPPGQGECVLRPDEGLDAVSAMAPGLLTSGLSQVLKCELPYRRPFVF